MRNSGETSGRSNTETGLVTELRELRRRLVELEREEAECRQREEALRESERRFRGLVEVTSDWVWEVDENLIYTYVSPRVRDLLGYEPQEILGRSPFDFMLPDEAHRVAELFGPIVEQHKPFSELENVNRHKDGHLIVLETSGVPIFDDDRRFRGYRGIDRDITERKKAEEEREQLLRQLRAVNSQLAISSLQAKEQAEVAQRRSSELEAVLDGIADGVFVCDKESRIVDVNKAGLKIIGLTSKEEALRPEADYLRLLDLRHPDGRPISENELVLSRALRGETIREFEQLARDIRTGRDVYFMVSAAPLRDREGRIIGAVAVLTDITRIRELDKLKDDFISVAAHELKTPVAIMKGYAQALLRTIEEMPEPRRKMLDGINRGADRIDRIIKDLLDISRLHLGHLELSVERIDLPEMVDEVVNRAAATTTKHRVRVVRAEPVVVQGDRDRLEQVLFSLLDNAIKYSPKGGDIDVAVEVRDHEAVVSVTDRGVGIPREKQNHIFERFYSAHTGTPYDYGGMGVGLFISREIVGRHGGRMWFESEEGKGSSFHFSLPLRGEYAGS
ncbi:MAG: PAS domain S-box protein [Chloroflexi bacterium]|nr:PAS domain S-box protein [Chloroflexota bacterium]